MKTFTLDECFAEAELARAFFLTYGFFHVKDFYHADDCSSGIEAIEMLESSVSESNTINLVTEKINGDTKVKYYQGIFSLDGRFRRFLNLKLLNLAAILLGTESIYYADLEAHIRNPGGGEIPKHQDNFYFNLSKASGLTAYIALSKHDDKSGGLNYKVQSHSKILDHSLSRVEGFSSFIDDSSDELKLINSGVYSPVYGIGDVTLHHPNNIHWSQPCPMSSKRGYALSARIFDSSEVIDPAGVDRYKRLLRLNRNES